MEKKKRIEKPEWLKVDFTTSNRYTETKRVIETHGLHTICSSGRCPNRGECWGKGTATFLIGGNICTRNCRFCNTITGRPLPPDPHEPVKVARSIALMKLSHAVITSVDRDDLPDLGAGHWVSVIREVKKQNPDTTLEVLIPDFRGKEELLDQVIATAPDIISHNIETIKRLSPLLRSGATYERSLKVLSYLAGKGVMTKSGMMVGLGETPEEVEQTMDDLRQANCRILTIGQYLRPTHKHWPVSAYITPEEFGMYRIQALEKGFSQVESGPLVRSSYHAEKHIIRKI